MSVLKIMHVCKKYPNAIGGDAAVVGHLERMQKASSDDVVIVTTDCEETLDGRTIYKFGLRTKASSLDKITIKRLVSLADLFLKSFRLLRLEKPDIIHTHSPDMLFVVSFAARHYRVPIIHTCHVVTFSDLRHDLVRRKSELSLLKWSGPRRVTAPNSSVVEDLKGAGIKPVAILPNGVDVGYWQGNNRANAKGDFIFVAIGRLEMEKGFNHLLNAAALLSKRASGFRVLIIGDGSEKESLTRLAASLSIGAIVTFLGLRSHDQVKEIFATAGAMVISSLWETTPITLLEAWASRVPVISTNVGILKDSVGSDDVAFVVGVDDDSALENAMYRVMTNSEEARVVADHGFAEVTSKYTWEKVYESVERLYREVLS